MSRNLAYIKSNFSVISKSITRLEAVGMQLCSALKIVKEADSELHKAQGEVAVKISAKLRVLQRNPGYSTLCTISIKMDLQEVGGVWKGWMELVKMRGIS